MNEILDHRPSSQLGGRFLSALGRLVPKARVTASTLILGLPGAVSNGVQLSEMGGGCTLLFFRMHQDSSKKFIPLFNVGQINKEERALN
jgi:hypothetical protein